MMTTKPEEAHAMESSLHLHIMPNGFRLCFASLPVWIRFRACLALFRGKECEFVAEVIKHSIIPSSHKEEVIH